METFEYMVQKNSFKIEIVFNIIIVFVVIWPI